MRAGLVEHKRNQSFEIDHPLMHQFESQTHRGFQSGDSKRRLIKLQRFFVRVMRRMIGGNRINRSIPQPLQQAST